MMRSAARLHPDKARHHVGEPRLDLSTRPFLAQCDRAPLIEANQVERVLSDIDTNDRNSCSGFLWHGVLLIVGAPRQFAAPAGAEARPDHSMSRHAADMQMHGGAAAASFPYAYRGAYGNESAWPNIEWTSSNQVANWVTPPPCCGADAIYTLLTTLRRKLRPRTCIALTHLSGS